MNENLMTCEACRSEIKVGARVCSQCSTSITYEATPAELTRALNMGFGATLSSMMLFMVFGPSWVNSSFDTEFDWFFGMHGLLAVAISGIAALFVGLVMRAKKMRKLEGQIRFWIRR